MCFVSESFYMCFVCPDVGLKSRKRASAHSQTEGVIIECDQRDLIVSPMCFVCVLYVFYMCFVCPDVGLNSAVESPIPQELLNPSVIGSSAVY